MPELVHGTAVAIGTTALILIGPSGAGKSSMALRLISEARRHGHLGALLGDDQVLVGAVNGRVIATAPPAIKGMIEIRGSGIGRIDTVESVVLDFALQLVHADASNRIPEQNQCWSPAEGVALPVLCIDRTAVDPFARLSALIRGFPLAPIFEL